MNRRPVLLCLLAFILLAACAKDEISQVGPSPEPKPEGPVPAVAPGMGTDLLSFAVEVGGKRYDAFCPAEKNWTVIVPDGTDLAHLVPLFTHNAATVTVKDVAQVSGVTENNFTGFRFGLTYHLTSLDGKSADHVVRVIDTHLPVVAVTTAEPGKIKNRTTWRGASVSILNPDGSVTRLGDAEIRGRGNWTWEKYPKRPYALKLGTKQPVMGMPAHKRWCLLALYRGFIGNPLMFEATRRAPELGWAPRGCFVELILNGKFQGLYYLCEQIKIDENRVNIAKMDEKDVSYPAVSGGYLLEYDEVYDEKYKFVSQSFSLPVQLKSPNDTVPDAQFNYIRDFINDMEKEIKKIGTAEESRYADYLDMDNFAEYWMVLESITNYEAWKPRSIKMYKGRDGVDSPKGTVCLLKAGPLWDQELFLVDHEFNTKDAHYFKYLFRDPAFVAAVKEHWVTYKSNLLGNDRFDSLVEYLNQIVELISTSAGRDLKYWGNDYFTFEGEVATVRNGFVSKINWMDSKIKAL